MRFRVWLMLLLLAAAAPAQERVKRHVIGLMGGKGPEEHTEDDIHALLELPINHCGMVVHRHYLENGPPPAEWLKDARAVLTYFGADTKPEDWLWPWLEKARDEHGLRIIHFGELGPLNQDKKRLAAWLDGFGLTHQDLYSDKALQLAIEYWDDKSCMYEASARRRATHRGPRSVDPRNKVWVTTRDRTDGTVCHPVVTGPWGAIALDPWTLRKGGEAMDRRWHLDPFRFVVEALGAQRVPAPHPCVLNGRRMWFLQIDGDGFESLSTVQPDEYSAKVMYEDVLLRYYLPYTISIIVRSLTLDYNVEKPTKAMELARKILNMPNAEAASHGVLHTLQWQRKLKKTSPPRDIMWYPSLKNYTYSADNEVSESIRFINERLLDDGKKCVVMLWTGHANPFESAIQAATDAGAWNLNGGVYRWDRLHDSVGFVTPWGRQVGKALQVYAGAANENDFKGFFTTMPGSFFHIDQTLERTGSPRILKPADIYIHFYSAERPARLRSIHRLMKKWAYEKPVAPVLGSVYCKAVVSAVETAKIERTETGWRFRDFGGCKTVRIDDEPRTVDMTKSTGLFGYKRDGPSLYLHLAAGDAEVVLADEAPLQPYVHEASCHLGDVEFKKRSIAVTATAHCYRVVVFGGFPPDRRVVVETGARRRIGMTDKHGRVEVKLDDHGTTRIAVRLR